MNKHPTTSSTDAATGEGAARGEVGGEHGGEDVGDGTLGMIQSHDPINGKMNKHFIRKVETTSLFFIVFVGVPLPCLLSKPHP